MQHEQKQIMHRIEGLLRTIKISSIEKERIKSGCYLLALLFPPACSLTGIHVVSGKG
jgi:hypothetical protein